MWIELPDVTRLTVVDRNGVVFERYDLFKNGIEIHLQDDGRTLKIFERLDTASSDPDVE